MIHQHYSIDIGYDDDKDVVAWSEITLSGKPIAECEQSDRELLQKGLDHYGITFMLREFGAAEIRQIYEKGITPKELYANLKNNTLSDETIMLILNCIGYEEKSWVEFVRKELEKRKGRV